MKKILICLFFLLSSCGYQSIYVGKDSNNFLFNEIILTGDNKINQRIVSVLNFEEDKSNNAYDKIILNSTKNTIGTSKDSKGQIISYKTSINVKLIIEENGKVLKTKTFTDYFSYNNKDNKFELAEYQNEVENNLTKSLIDEIFLYLNI